MKKCMWIFLTCSCMTFVPLKSHAIIWAVIQAAATKVIKAMDLAIQRLQNQTIALQNAQKAIENTMSKLKLGEISGWVEAQRKQYEQYYSELWKVRNAISYYRRIKEIVSRQVDLVGEYKRSFALFKKDKHFTPQEIKFMGTVYDGILDESLKNIDELFLVVNSFTTEMSDAGRLELIARAAAKVDDNFMDLKSFNNANALLSVQRARDATEIMQLKALYDLK